MGALCELFPGVQMGKMTVEGKAFQKTNPNILEVSFTGLVSHGVLFFKLLEELVERQLVEDKDGKDRYINTVMKDDQGNDTSAYLARDGGKMRRCTGQVT